MLARSRLRNARQISRQDRSDAGISARCLAFAQQHKGRAIARDLDIARHNHLREDAKARFAVKPLAIRDKTYAHSVAARIARKTRSPETFNLGGTEEFRLQAGYDPNRPATEALFRGQPPTCFLPAVFSNSETIAYLDLRAYSCRQMRTSRGTSFRMSQHATANAIDISGFRLADGRSITLLRDWDGDTAKAAFLREVRDGLCDWFNITLSPDYNRLHADHFHADMGPFLTCR